MKDSPQQIWRAVTAGAGVLSWIGALLGWVVTPVYFAFFLMADAKRLVDLDRFLPFLKPETRRDVAYLIREFVTIVVAFFRGQLILMGIVAVMTLAGYLIAGMPYALALGLIAGLCEAIPIVGPTLAVIPAILIAISAAPDKLVAAIAVGAIVQLLENNLLVPRIMDESVGVNPVITIIAIAAFGGLFGFAGALSEIGLPEHAIPLALLFFNLGVEAGQLLFIAAVFGVSMVLKRINLPGWAWRVPVYAIGSLAAFWVLERCLGSYGLLPY